MEAISEFDFRPLTIPDSKGVVSELLMNGRFVGITLNGRVLEGQLRIGSNFLVLSSDDSPYEEGLYIYYLSEDFQVLDQLEMGIPYSPGALRDLHISSPHDIEFSFFANDRWRITVLTHPYLILCPLSKFPVRRPIRRFLSRGYLKVTRVDLLQTNQSNSTPSLPVEHNAAETIP